MGAKWRKAGIIFVLWLVVISMIIRSIPPIFNTEIEPPTSGLLPYLQQGDMPSFSDNGYKVVVDMKPKVVQRSSEDMVEANDILEIVDSDIQRNSGNDQVAGGDVEDAYHYAKLAHGNPQEVDNWMTLVITLQVLNSSDIPVNVFSEDMTKLMHLIVVDKSLRFFAHVHPIYEGNGIFRAELTVPYGGNYLFVTEFIPDKKGVTVYKQWLNAAGKVMEPIHETLDEVYATTVDGVSFTLSVMPSFKELRAGEMVMLNFHYEDAITGESIELEPFLGTSGHGVIFDMKAEQYVHVHAADGMSSEGNVMFHAEFPKSGLYKVWGQFKYKGKIIIVPYLVEVK